MAASPGLTPRGVAAFDFDGTLVRGDSLPAFVSRVHGAAKFLAIFGASLPSMTLRYRSGGRDAAKEVLLSRAFTGMDANDVKRVGEGFGEVLAHRIRPAMAERIAWHDDQGHRRILVSASLAVYLETFGRLVGFEEVIATRLETGADGRLTGRLDGPNVRAGVKAARLAELLGNEPAELWAYGDSAGDREMLAMADHPVYVGRRFGAD